MVDGITCEIAGLQIADPMQTLDALRRGTTRPPSGLSTDQFTQLLLGCLGGNGTGSGKHTNNFANPYEHDSDGVAGPSADPAAFGNTAGYPVTTTSFATGAPVSPSAPAGSPDTAINPSSAGGNSQTTDTQVAPSPPTDASGSTEDEALSAGDNTAPVSVNPPAATTDVSKNSPPPTNANEGGTPISQPADSPAAVAPPPASESPTSLPAAVAPPSNPPTSSDAPPTSDLSSTSGPASSSDASFNPSESRTANNAVSGTTGDGSSADTGVGAPNASPVGTSPSTPHYLPYDGAPGSSGQAGEVDNFGFYVPRHHSNHGANNAAACDGMACVADSIIPAGVSEAPVVGTNGLTNGNAGGCPSGDVDLCFDLGTR